METSYGPLSVFWKALKKAKPSGIYLSFNIFQKFLAWKSYKNKQHKALGCRHEDRVC